MITENLVMDIHTAIRAFEPTADLHLAAWFGTADRLAHFHPSGMLELLGDETRPNAREVGGIDFVTAVGPRSYWPEEEARAYRNAVVACTQGGRPTDDAAHAAKALVAAARRLEGAWSRQERLFRMTAAIMGWIFWDEEPGARWEIQRIELRGQPTSEPTT